MKNLYLSLGKDPDCTQKRRIMKDLLILMISCACMIFMLGGDVSAQITPDEAVDAETADDLEFYRAFDFEHAESLPEQRLSAGGYVANFVIEDIVKSTQYRRLYKNADYRYELAEQIGTAAASTKVPPGLLTVLAYKESSFLPKAEGGQGEKGLLQVIPGGSADQDCDLDTAEGQLDCGSRWLRVCYKKCKNWYGALMAYKTGHCETKSIDVQKKILHRLNVWNKYRRRIRAHEKSS